MAKNGIQLGPGLWPSLIISAIGGTLLTIGAILFFQNTFELVTSDSIETPASETRDLGVGEYEVYSLLTTVDFFNLDEIEFDRPLTRVDDIRVENTATGEQLRLTSRSSDVTLGRQSNVYALVAGFEVEAAAEYEITISGDPNQAVVGRSFESGFRNSVPWLIMLGVGAVIALAGIIMLIVGIVRRMRAKRNAVSYAAPAGYPGAGTPPPVTPGATANPVTAPPNPSTAPPSTTPTPPAPPQPAPPPASPNPNTPDTDTPWG